jgi:tetratricopeptide (TPR) repeat protein
VSTLTYLNFDAQIERSGDGYVMFVESPTGEAIRMAFEPPFSDLELENFLLRAGPSRRGVRRIDTQEVEAAKQFGGRMFNALFDGEARSALQSSINEARRRSDTGRSRVGVRIRLRLAGAPELANLPWEYIYNNALNRFLVLSVETPLVRYLDLPERIRPVKVTPPLRVLVAIAGPREYPRLDAQEEWARLQSALDDLLKDGLVEMHLLETPTLPALQRQLRRGSYHVLHFIGHGGYDHRAQDGLLVFEDDEQRARLVSGQDLGMLLHDHTSLRLAILNACEGARTGSDDPFAGVAQSLVQQGIPAVIAMQFEITDAAAITFAHEFYRAIADGYPVDASLAESRKVMFAEARGNGLEWGTPVLYMRSPDGRIFDVQRRMETQPLTRPLEAKVQEPASVEPGPVVAAATPVETPPPPVVAAPAAPAETEPPTARIPAPATAPIPEPEPVVAIAAAQPVEAVTEEPVARGIAATEAPRATVEKPAAQVPAAPARKRSMLPAALGALLLVALVAGGIWLFSSGILSGPSTSESPSDVAVKHFEAGMTYYDNEDFVGAISEYDQAIRWKPDYLEAYYWRGMCYAIKGHYDEALADFDEIIRQDPEQAIAYYEKGRVYENRGEVDEAIAQFTEAIDHDDGFANAYLDRGKHYFDRGDYDAAIADFEKAIELEPTTFVGYWYRGRIYYNQSEYDLAIDDFSTAIDLYSEYDVMYSARGDAYVETGQNDEAIEDFRKVLELTNDDELRSHAEEQLSNLGEEP